MAESDWVIVVDDDISNLKTAGLVLSKANMRVTALKSGEALLEYLQKEETYPDLILLDILMPEMDGFETIQKLRAQDDKIKKIPVIFLTANEDSEYETKGLQLGAMDFIKKPFSPQVLVTRVKHTIELTRLQENLEQKVDKKTKEILQINDVFGKNVSPQIRDYLLKGNVALGGENVNITVMFCDIRSFTTLSESLPSQTVVTILNRYFTALEKCISCHNGIINKYMGDGLMALFGVPIPSNKHQLDAFEAALEMREALKELNVSFKKDNLPELSFGIGLHSGNVVAGNIGAESRMEYTVIGDTVNTASRIEGVCKVYKRDLLISESTAEAILSLSPETSLEFVDSTEIRGRTEKVKIFGLKS